MGGSHSRAVTPPRAEVDLTRFAWLAIGAAVTTIALKVAAYLVTDSVGLLSDAAESVVNLVAAFAALLALHIAAKPPDDSHHFGHSKAEYFSAAVEGIMIFVAAVFIIVAAVRRFLAPQELEQVGIGLTISVIAAVVNGLVGVVLIRAGRRHRSITLEADGRHLMTDVITSVGVVIGVALVALTGWLRLDPVVAFLVGANILWTGWRLVRRSVDGLMDHTLSGEDNARLIAVLTRFASDEVSFHHVRTREAAAMTHVTMHVLVPGTWSVQRGHDLLEEIEDALRAEFDQIQVVTHIEPIEDPRSHREGPGLSVPCRHDVPE